VLVFCAIVQKNTFVIFDMRTEFSMIKVEIPVLRERYKDFPTE